MNKGFTLAEVLVTLGIIGVISAMTLPTLVKNHQRQVYVAQLRKVVSEISQIAEQAINDNNAVSLCETPVGNIGGVYLLKNYFKTVKFCDDADTSDCFAGEYKNLNGQPIRIRDIVSGQSAILNDGTSIYLSNSCNYTYITVDINGKQGPNIAGRDLFSFTLEPNASISVAYDMETRAKNFSSECFRAVYDYDGGCFSKLLNDGWKMDY